VNAGTIPARRSFVNAADGVIRHATLCRGAGLPGASIRIEYLETKRLKKFASPQKDAAESHSFV
jgi:hypothetical protein